MRSAKPGASASGSIARKQWPTLLSRSAGTNVPTTSGPTAAPERTPLSTSTSSASAKPLVPPSGSRLPAIAASGSVVGWPPASTAHPSGTGSPPPAPLTICPLDGELHGPHTGQRPQPVVRVQHEGGGPVAEQPERRPRVDQPDLQPVEQERQPEQAVGGLALQLGLHQALGDQRRAGLRHVVGGQRADDVSLQRLVWKA